MDLTNLLQTHLSGDFIDQLSTQIGGADKQKTAIAASGIVSTLMGAMARNTATPQGAQSLNQALERDNHGEVLNNISGLLGGSRDIQPENSRALNGAGILGHVLGNRQGPAVEMISRMSGLDQNKVSMLMTVLAPVVMGMLGKAKKQENLDAGGLSDLLGGFVNSQKQQQNPAMGMLERFLDQDGDGSIQDDVMDIGKKMLGGFFNRR